MMYLYKCLIFFEVEMKAEKIGPISITFYTNIFWYVQPLGQNRQAGKQKP